MRKKTIPAILAAAMVMLTGCSGVDPSDGWTIDELNAAVRIGGKQITVPFKINDLGSKFTSSSFGISTEKFDLQIIKYDGDLVGSASMKPAGENNEFEISYIIFKEGESDVNFSDVITINGLTIGDSADKASKKFGKPTLTKDGRDFYKCDDYYFSCECVDGRIKMLGIGMHPLDKKEN